MEESYMDIEKTTDIYPDDILPDGLPRILPPYENGVFQTMLTLPEAKKALVSEMSRLERWVIFFALGNQPKYREIIAEITKHQEGIAVANEVLQGISQNPDERALEFFKYIYPIQNSLRRQFAHNPEQSYIKKMYLSDREGCAAQG